MPLQPNNAARQQESKREKQSKQKELELYAIQQAVGRILDDYKQTAQTLDDVTAQVDGINATDHASNVDTLKANLIDELQIDPTSAPPWEQDGYNSKTEWLNDI